MIEPAGTSISVFRAARRPGEGTRPSRSGRSSVYSNIQHKVCPRGCWESRRSWDSSAIRNNQGGSWYRGCWESRRGCNSSAIRNNQRGLRPCRCRQTRGSRRGQPSPEAASPKPAVHNSANRAPPSNKAAGKRTAAAKLCTARSLPLVLLAPSAQLVKHDHERVAQGRKRVLHPRRHLLVGVARDKPVSLELLEV